MRRGSSPKMRLEVYIIASIIEAVISEAKNFTTNIKASEKDDNCKVVFDELKVHDDDQDRKTKKTFFHIQFSPKRRSPHFNSNIKTYCTV